MTVEYNNLVSTSTGLGNFGLLLLRWKGSIYKLVYPDLLLYLSLFFSIFFSYRFYFVEHPYSRRVFEAICRYCLDFGQLIPVSFVLGFYVSQVVSRWWTQFMTCPWPDTLAVLIATHVQGTGERSRLMRRTIMRYVNLSFTLTMIMMSPQAKARFPDLDHLVDAGLLMPHEKLVIEHLNEKSTYAKYWIPLIWAGGVVMRARREGRIADDMALNKIVNAITRFRGGLGDLLGFDWVNIPLVYTQVVTLAVYLYFIAGLFGRQIIVLVPTEKVPYPVDTYFPVFLFVEFFFYIGWLKVAETMLNPWGEDDDDFEVNWLIDRNITVAYLIVDEMHAEHPEMLRDNYWDEVVPEELPYNAASIKYKKEVIGSAETRQVDEERAEFITGVPDAVVAANRFRRSIIRADSEGQDAAQQVAKGLVRRTRSTTSGKTGSTKSSKDYKNYMDNTFVPIEKDMDER